MTRTGTVRALVALLLVVPAVAASAKTQQVACHLLTDPAGDVQPTPGTEQVPVKDDRDDELDILSADIATDAKNLTVVIRLKTLLPPDATSLNGVTYQFDFSAKEHSYFVIASRLTGGDEFEVYVQDQRVDQGDSSARSGSGIGDATGIFDVARHEIRMSAPLTMFAPTTQLRTGTSLYDLDTFSSRANGAATQSPRMWTSVAVGADTVFGQRASYRVGAPSCIQSGGGD